MTGVQTCALPISSVRFMLTYAPEKDYPAYAQVMIRTEERDQIPGLIKEAMAWTSTELPNAFVKFKRLQVGPGTDAKIEARFSGPDQAVLRGLAEQAEAIFLADPDTDSVRNNWRQRVKVVRPVFNEDNARRAGISKQDLDDFMHLSFSGKKIGVYRDGTNLKDIIMRPPAEERLDIDSLMELQIWSPEIGRASCRERV